MDSDWIARLAEKVNEGDRARRVREELQLHERRKLKALMRRFPAELRRLLEASIDEWNAAAPESRRLQLRSLGGDKIKVEGERSSVEIEIDPDAERIYCFYFIWRGPVTTNPSAFFYIAMHEGIMEIRDEAGHYVPRDRIAQRILSRLLAE